MLKIIAELNKIRDQLVATSLMLHDGIFEMAASQGGLPPAMTVESTNDLGEFRLRDAAGRASSSAHDD